MFCVAVSGRCVSDTRAEGPAARAGGQRIGALFGDASAGSSAAAACGQSAANWCLLLARSKDLCGLTLGLNPSGGGAVAAEAVPARPSSSADAIAISSCDGSSTTSNTGDVRAT